MKLIYDATRESMGEFAPEKLTIANGFLSVQKVVGKAVHRFHLLAADVRGYEFEDEYEARLFDESVHALLAARAETDPAPDALPRALIEDVIRSAVDELPIGTVVPMHDGPPK